MEMEKGCLDRCPLYRTRMDGTMAGEKKFKYRAVMTERGQIVACMCQLDYARAGFVEYSRDENGEIDGAVISCDLGYGYSFDDGKETVTLHPYESHSFFHSYTDTSDGTWDDDSYCVTITLLPFDEEECSWKR